MTNFVRHLYIKNHYIWFIFDRPYLVRSHLCYSVVSIICCLSSSVTLCIVAKRCVLEQKLLLIAYRKSYMRNWLVMYLKDHSWLRLYLVGESIYSYYNVTTSKVSDRWKCLDKMLLSSLLPTAVDFTWSSTTVTDGTLFVYILNMFLGGLWQRWQVDFDHHTGYTGCVWRQTDVTCVEGYF